MRVAVIGASGAMGSRIVGRLQHDGQDVVTASKKTGVDAFTGEGVGGCTGGRRCRYRCHKLPALSEKAMHSDLLQANGKKPAGCSKGVRSSGTWRSPSSERTAWFENDYFRGKLVQENLIRSSGLPHTIVRSTQFFEFFSGIVNASAVNGDLRLPSIAVRPVSADEAANWVTKLAVDAPQNTILELGGPEFIELSELARELLTATADNRLVSPDQDAPYFGVALPPDGLLPMKQTMSGKLFFHDWLSQSIAA